MKLIADFTHKEIIEQINTMKPMSVVTEEKLAEIEKRYNLKKELAGFCFYFFNILFESNEETFRNSLLPNGRLNYSLLKGILNSRKIRKELGNSYKAHFSYFIDNVVNNDIMNTTVIDGNSIARVIVEISIAYTTIMNKGIITGCSGENMYRSVPYADISRYNAFINSIE